jgi:hypothetical protein
MPHLTPVTSLIFNDFSRRCYSSSRGSSSNPVENLGLLVICRPVQAFFLLTLFTVTTVTKQLPNHLSILIIIILINVTVCNSNPDKGPLCYNQLQVCYKLLQTVTCQLLHGQLVEIHLIMKVVTKM